MARRRRSSRNQTRTLLLIAAGLAAYWYYVRSQPAGAVTLPSAGYVPAPGTTYTPEELAALGVWP